MVEFCAFDDELTDVGTFCTSSAVLSPVASTPSYVGLDDKRFASYSMRSGMASHAYKVNLDTIFFNVHALGNNVLQNTGIAAVNTQKD